MDPELMQQIGQLQAKMDQALNDLKDVKARLTELEKWKWKITGAALLLGGGAGGFWGKILGA